MKINKLKNSILALFLLTAGSSFANAETISELWSKYKNDQLVNSVRMHENQNKEISFNGLIMKYQFTKIGSEPEGGYPLYIALHGGGGAPAYINDSQWYDMQSYYLKNVKQGIYLAPRGITNTWNLHSVDESYPMYDRLIENMILFENVNPNKVYVLGYSAGGDGVYQIAPRMSDRFAAADMSAGHPNGISLKNLFQVPFLIQVGEYDSAYNRNKVDAEYCLQLQALHNSDPQGYVNECNVHVGKPHNFYDNDPNETPQSVIASPEKWLKLNDRSSVTRNTSAIAWLSKFTRNPLPNEIIWDLNTRANRTGVDKNGVSLWGNSTHGNQNYWLDIANKNSSSLGVNEIRAKINASRNAIEIQKAAPYLKILLKQSMLNLSEPVNIIVEGKELSLKVTPNLKTMTRTLLERGDINYIFEAAVLVEKNSGNWTVSQVD